MMQQPRVPAGYRFRPTAGELIRNYLNPWVTGQTADVVPGIVCIADVYAAAPDALTSRFRDSGHDGNNWYFLCVARWKGGKAGTRMSRCVQGGGTWHGTSRRKAVGLDGHRQSFEYRAAGNKKTVWIMEEFVTRMKEAADGEGVKVLCNVHVSPRALPLDDDEEEEEEETNKVVVVPNELLLLLHGQHDDVERSRNIASTSHQGGLLMGVAAETECRDNNEVAGYKRARLDGEHGLGAYTSVSMAPPPPPEYYATWQQSMMEQGMGVDGEPEPLVAVDNTDVEGLPLPPTMDDYGALDVTPLNARLNEEWWREWVNPDFSFGVTDNGVEGGDGPTTAAS